jgi:hypothetical protein
VTKIEKLSVLFPKQAIYLFTPDTPKKPETKRKRKRKQYEEIEEEEDEEEDEDEEEEESGFREKPLPQRKKVRKEEDEEYQEKPKRGKLTKEEEPEEKKEKALDMDVSIRVEVFSSEPGSKEKVTLHNCVFVASSRRGHEKAVIYRDYQGLTPNELNCNVQHKAKVHNIDKLRKVLILYTDRSFA